LPDQLDDQNEPTIAELIHQLVDDARAFVRAEANLYRTIAQHRLTQARAGMILVAAGGLLLLAALITLLVMLAQGLALHIGPVGAGLLVAGVALGGGYLLLRYGIERLGGLLGDEEEERALRDGETKA
jgi:hypothetical protein